MSETKQECEPTSHQFEGRYDIINPVKSAGFLVSAKVIEAMREKIYVKDICVKCGKTIKRNQV